MVTTIWARLEDERGRVVGSDPAWTPQRQFLWEVIHDTRGLLRGDSFADDLALIRTLDAPRGRGGPRFALDPVAVRAVYERVVAAANERGSDGPTFRLVAPAGSEEWAAVHFFEEEGGEYALVGGWTGPLLRTLSPEPDQQFLSNQTDIAVGRRRFHVKAVPFAEYFAEDFRSLFALLMRAQTEKLRIRFLQR